MMTKRLMSPLLSLCAVGLLASGCASEGPSIQLSLMDAPPKDVTAVKIYVASMDVHVDGKAAKDADPADATIDDSKKWVSLIVGKEIDLVQHQGETAADVLGSLDLPEGKITQIRLRLDTTKPNTATVKGVDCNLDTSKVAAKGIKINHVFKAFTVGESDTLEALVDFELDKSLKDDGKGCFVLEPKLKLHKVKRAGKEVAI